MAERKRSDILDTARAILTLARSGATEGERDAALHRLAAFIKRHKITQAELDSLEGSRHYREEGLRLPSNEKWRKTLASVIGGHFGCKVLSAFRQVYFVGTEKARKDAIEMYEHVLPQAIRLHDTVAPERMRQLRLRHRNVYRVGFFMGFCQGLDDRFKLMRASRYYERPHLPEPAPSAGDVDVATALAVVERSLAEYQGTPTDEQIDEMYQQRVKPDPWQPPADVSREAFNDGRRAARGCTLSRYDRPPDEPRLGSLREALVARGWRDLDADRIPWFPRLGS